LLPVQLQHLQVLTLGINPVVVLLPEFIYGLAAVLVLVQLVVAVVAAVVHVLLLNTYSQRYQVQSQLRLALVDQLRLVQQMLMVLLVQIPPLVLCLLHMVAVADTQQATALAVVEEVVG
jgi:hypothetical protein